MLRDVLKRDRTKTTCVQIPKRHIALDDKYLDNEDEVAHLELYYSPRRRDGRRREDKITKDAKSFNRRDYITKI